jgi:hypothetical protein
MQYEEERMRRLVITLAVTATTVLGAWDTALANPEGPGTGPNCLGYERSYAAQSTFGTGTPYGYYQAEQARFLAHPYGQSLDSYFDIICTEKPGR